MKRVTAALVPEQEELVVDDVVDSRTFSPTVAVSEEVDGFKDPIKKHLPKQSRKTKNKYYKLRKQWGTGVDGAKSKYEDPELVNGYGMFDVVEPPYNLDTLASLFDENAIHNACIMARSMNTVGLGYNWEDTAKSKRRQEKAQYRYENASEPGDASVNGFSEGDVVSWADGARTLRGQVEHVMDEGTLDIPSRGISLQTSESSPAALITIYRNGQPTNQQAAVYLSELAKESTSRKVSEDSMQRLRNSLVREEQRLHDLFDSFNEFESFTETLVKIWIDVLSTGNGYMEVGRSRSGKIGYVGHIPSIHIRVRRARDGFVQKSGSKFIFFRNFGDIDVVDPINGDPNPNEIIHFNLYSPTNTYYGVPSAVAALSALVGDKFAKEYNIDYFENKSIPRYAIILKGAKLSEKSKQEVVNYFRNEIKGNNHGTLFVPLPATLGKEVDIKFEKLENNVQEGSFDKYRKSNRDEIMVAHRVPAPKIGVYDNANLAVSRDADKTFKVQVISPDQKIIEKKINRIVKEFSDIKQFKFAEIDIIDDDIRSRIWDRYLRTEVVTPNEVRANLGMNPVNDGDHPLPYPTRLQKEKNDFDMKQAASGEQTSPNQGGGQIGNSNALAGSPPRSRQDAAASESSQADATSGRRERGERQDQEGVS
jgi:PBSX family phage portal protein